MWPYHEFILLDSTVARILEECDSNLQLFIETKYFKVSNKEILKDRHLNSFLKIDFYIHLHRKLWEKIFGFDWKSQKKSVAKSYFTYLSRDPV